MEEWVWTTATNGNYTIVYSPEYFTLEEAFFIAEQFHAEQMGW
jgi:hypothetical protein